MQNDILQLHQEFCNYCVTCKNNTPATIRWYKEGIGLLVRHSKANELAELSERAIELWLQDGRINKKWRPRTVRNRIQSVALFFSWCVQKEHLLDDPSKNISIPKVPKTIPKHLSKELAFTLLDWTRNFPYQHKFGKTRAIAIIATFIYSGVRVMELENLRMEDINLTSKTLFIHNGKGQKDRLIPLNKNLIDIYENYLQERRKLKKMCPYFFTDICEDKKIGYYMIRQLVARLRKYSGIYFYPHMLRHTFAILMLEGGCDIFSLSMMMGHSDIQTTTIYLSASIEHLQKQMLKHPLLS